MGEVSIITNEEISRELTVYDSKMLQVISSLGLPTENILVKIDERKRVFRNTEDVLELLSEDQLSVSYYISKFLAAVSAGLFDAALNYMWDETISQLRIRVAQYDIQYFYDLAVTSDKRNKLSTVDDLVKLDDSELIKGAKDIDLISDIGYRLLDNIKFMRNWASAAHPNQVELSGLQLISWLETCIREVICLPVTNVTIQISKLLRNIKDQQISSAEARNIAVFFIDLPDNKVSSLASGLFGIYTRKDTSQTTRNNIHYLLPLLWPRVDESLRYDFGTKYAQFVANNELDEVKLARSFLQIVNAEQYLPTGIRVAEIKIALENLISAHRAFNNFYSEPSFASQLNRLIGNQEIPKEIDIYLARVLVYVYITNGNGVCYDADKIYTEMLKKMNQRQSTAAVMSCFEDAISSKLQFHLCKRKYLEMLDLISPNITSQAVQDFILELKKFRGDLSQIIYEKYYREKADAIKTLLK